MDSLASRPSRKQTHLRYPSLTPEHPGQPHQCLGTPKSIPAHQQPNRQLAHTSCLSLALTGVNRSQCTPALSEQAGQPPHCQSKHPKANPLYLIQIQL